MNNYLTSRQIWSVGIATVIIVLPVLIVWDKYHSTPFMDSQSVDGSRASVSTERVDSTGIWFERSFQDGDNKIHAIFTQTPRLDEDGAKKDCHICGVAIGVVTYKQVAAGWEFISMQSEITELGQWGDAPEVKEAKVLRLAPGKVTFLINETGLNQGYYTDWVDLLAYSQGKWQDLGAINMGQSNTGVCSDPPPPNKDAEDFGRCWSYKGEISIKTRNKSEYPDLLVSLTGTEQGKDKLHVIPVNRVVKYVFNGEKYIESTAARNASGG